MPHAAGAADSFGPLQPPDANGLMLPPGFSSRVVATSGQIVAGTSFSWHGSPDGGATFSKLGEGWVYVSNIEVGAGGASAICFDTLGRITDAYSILSGTTDNCAGCPTPFTGGEGCWHDSGFVCFSTKRDFRVWVIDTFAETIEILYDWATSGDPELTNVDNVYVPPSGDVYVAEDRGNLEIVALTPLGDVKPIVRLVGVTGYQDHGPGALARRIEALFQLTAKSGHDLRGKGGPLGSNSRGPWSLRHGPTALGRRSG